MRDFNKRSDINKYRQYRNIANIDVESIIDFKIAMSQS